VYLLNDDFVKNRFGVFMAVKFQFEFLRAATPCSCVAGHDATCLVLTQLNSEDHTPFLFADCCLVITQLNSKDHMPFLFADGCLVINGRLDGDLRCPFIYMGLEHA
jgi:hypothetical protein